MMDEQTTPSPYAWMDQTFANTPDVPPKHRDLLAMLAAAMMGDAGATQHFYNRAIANGASDDELQRMITLARAQGIPLDLADPKRQP